MSALVLAPRQSFACVIAPRQSFAQVLAPPIPAGRNGVPFDNGSTITFDDGSTVTWG